MGGQEEPDWSSIEVVGDGSGQTRKTVQVKQRRLEASLAEDFVKECDMK
jgi:hypothetical protein